MSRKEKSLIFCKYTVTATALLHLPVHALQQLPLLVGFVGWCLSSMYSVSLLHCNPPGADPHNYTCSATVCGLIMWE